VAIGHQAGYCLQHNHAVAIGSEAGKYCQCYSSVAIGNHAAQACQNQHAVAIGSWAGYCCQHYDAIAIGHYAGEWYQQSGAVAIGAYAGESSGCCGSSGQGYHATAVGYNAGSYQQQYASVALGSSAGRCCQGHSSVAIGHYAANYCQGADSIAIGRGAGRYHQGQYAVAVGYNAGYGYCYNGSCGSQCRQQDYSVAIGYYAGYNYQNQHSIAINATNTALNTETQGFYVNPVREDAGNTAYSVYYNETSKELTYTEPVALQLPQNLQDGAGDYVLVRSDAGKHIYKTNTGSVYVPRNSDVAFPIGTVITLITGSSHSTTVTSVHPETTHLILSKFGPDAEINIPADTYVTILKIETDKWMVQT
jgi:hypothetical protein